MEYFLSIVEGPHDAAFVGILLKELGYDKIDRLDGVDPYWRVLIPTVFPAGPRLEHVVRYPDMYIIRGDRPRSFAVSVACGDSRLLSELRASLEILDASTLSGVLIVADADDFAADRRFDQLLEGLVALNRSHQAGGPEGGVAGVAGFPLTLPAIRGEVAGGSPRVGIFVLPNNEDPGTLDAVLLECAMTSLPEFVQPSMEAVAAVDAAIGPEDARLKSLRKPSGRSKAAAAIIGNLLYPGSPMSTCIERGPWLRHLTGQEIQITVFRNFLRAFLEG
jgi:hypothetical protein